MKHIFLSILLAAFIVGCASSSLVVKSDPEGADVFVTQNGQPARKVGQTPLNTSPQGIGVTDGSYQISVKKEGFVESSVLVPYPMLSHQMTVNMKLTEGSLAMGKSGTDKVSDYQTLSRGVAQATSALMNKDYDVAEKIIGSLMGQFPTVATLYDLMGNIYFIRKDYTKAHSFYSKSVQLSETPEGLKMLKKLDELRGTYRVPSSERSF